MQNKFTHNYLFQNNRDICINLFCLDTFYAIYVQIYVVSEVLTNP